MFCNYCGANNPGDARFCRKCGKAIHPAQPQQTERSVEPPQPTPVAPLAGAPAASPARPSRNLTLPAILLMALCALGGWLWIRWRAAQPLTLTGHQSYISSVAFSPDGRLLASGSADHTVKLWEASSGKWLRTFAGTHGTDWVAFSPDGRLLASTGEPFSGTEPVVVLWDVPSGKELRVISPHVYFIGVVTFSRDGKIVAAATDSPDGKNPTVRLWDVASGSEVRTFSGLRGPLAFSPDGRTLAAGNDGSISFIDVTSGTQLRTLPGHPARDLVFSPNGQMLISVTGDNAITLWDAASGNTVRTFSDPGRIRGIAVSSNGRFLASGGEDRTIKLFDVSSGSVVRTLKGYTDSVNCMAFSPDGKLLASGGADGDVKLWRLPAN